MKKVSAVKALVIAVASLVHLSLSRQEDREPKLRMYLLWADEEQEEAGVIFELSLRLRRIFDMREGGVWRKARHIREACSAQA